MAITRPEGWMSRSSFDGRGYFSFDRSIGIGRQASVCPGESREISGVGATDGVRITFGFRSDGPGRTMSPRKRRSRGPGKRKWGNVAFDIPHLVPTKWATEKRFCFNYRSKKNL
ncbi:hypothetical protein GW17_00023490 [Ensete ventricosum]|nr:hypothetical protein GW17_00023490 [Ensete ventricosum]RZR78510.1 hypothetical protein BHM03_00003905 [Ensete ventricosum]